MDDYDVGYRKPPLHTRFTKGRSGNPRGRPRKTESATSSDIDTLFSEGVGTVNDKRRLRDMSGEEAMIRGLANKALAGCLKAATALFNYEFDLIRQLSACALTAANGNGIYVLPDDAPLDEWEAEAKKQQEKLVRVTGAQ